MGTRNRAARFMWELCLWCSASNWKGNGFCLISWCAVLATRTSEYLDVQTVGWIFIYCIGVCRLIDWDGKEGRDWKLLCNPLIFHVRQMEPGRLNVCPKSPARRWELPHWARSSWSAAFPPGYKRGAGVDCFWPQWSPYMHDCPPPGM